MRRMESGDFAVRLPVESRDEFGALAAGFNSMAERLQELYANLERRVAEKTRTLEDRNEELGTLYESAALLAQPAALETLCRDFVHKLMTRLHADAAAVRLVEPETEKIHLFVQEGVPEALVDAERCLQKGECLCGEGIKRPQPSVHILVRGGYRSEPYRCREAGFATVGVFPIRFRDQSLGLFNLFFRAPREFSTAERQLLDTLGQHLGIAVENQRLIAREKEMAISEERNLLAQELHDSIAQSLAFLNIQAQLLEQSLAHGRIDSAREELSRIREGIQESYDDVRELLVHFRTRMAESEIETAIAAALLRFEQQTQIEAKFSQSGVGLPLSPEAQLQVMHIVQESLSNARKHSGAHCVEVEMQRGPVYRFRVRDDGKGFDPASVPGDLHVGLRIMRERARRIGGELEVRSQPGRGTEVILTLPALQARAA
jgi:two-component system nitrate/nitrite sensor histidine kinase NarX